MTTDDLNQNWFLRIGHLHTIHLSEYADGKRIGFGVGMSIDRLLGISVVIAWLPMPDSSIRLSDLVSSIPSGPLGHIHHRIVGAPVRVQSSLSVRS